MTATATTVAVHPTWLKSVPPSGAVDLRERGLEVGGHGVGRGNELLASADLNGAVAPRGAHEPADRPAGGSARVPSAQFAINPAWVELALTAADLIAWPRPPGSRASLPVPSPRRYATGCCTPPESPVDNDGCSSGSTPPDRGVSNPPPRSRASTPRPADHPDRRYP
jgi:hypothetical protein